MTEGTDDDVDETRRASSANRNAERSGDAAERAEEVGN
ncbi:hypothetical protein SAMN05216278_1013 [Halopelagius longus]|uniref:Uncharacterized protein n=1 Tax=Halopelagius longus TaxID=1236180 RepID=A0A1H0Z513_9EURY|nr:hypothetical protein SAMN05216278_1013 [Halopelagius longus]